MSDYHLWREAEQRAEEWKARAIAAEKRCSAMQEALLKIAYEDNKVTWPRAVARKALVATAGLREHDADA